MKTIKIGSFEAKTHFSKLVRDVAKGHNYEILKRGKPVAVLSRIHPSQNYRAARAAMDYFHDLRRKSSVPVSEIRCWIDEGRR